MFTHRCCVALCPQAGFAAGLAKGLVRQCIAQVDAQLADLADLADLSPLVATTFTRLDSNGNHSTLTSSGIPTATCICID